MSVGVSLDALWEQLGLFGDLAYLVTVSGDGRPHVVSVTVRVEDRALVVGAGRTTRANVAAHATVTLLWPPRPADDYSLIVDGDGSLDDDPNGALSIQPTRAVLHRVADATGDGPGCVPVLPQAEPNSA